MPKASPSKSPRKPKNAPPEIIVKAIDVAKGPSSQSTEEDVLPDQQTQEKEIIKKTPLESLKILYATLALLRQQLAQADSDLTQLQNQEKIALEDPVEYVQNLKSHREKFPKRQKIAVTPKLDLETIIPPRSTSPLPYFDPFKNMNHLGASLTRPGSPSSPISRTNSPGFARFAPNSPGPLYISPHGFSTYENLKTILRQQGMDDFPTWLPILPQSPAPSPAPRSPIVPDTPRPDSPYDSPQFELAGHHHTGVLSFHATAQKTHSRAMGLGLRPDSPRPDSPRFRQPHFPPPKREQRKTRLGRSYTIGYPIQPPKRISSRRRHDSDTDEDKDVRLMKSDVEHLGYACDGCGDEPIKGTRYKCKECQELDFCEQCVKSGTVIGSHNNTHTYDVFENPEAPYYDVEGYPQFAPVNQLGQWK